MASKAKAKLEKDILEMEWKECRETIRNFDRTLSSFRIYSVLITLALMSIATELFIRSKIHEASIVELVTIAVIGVVFYLERHYRGFLLITVDRAIAIEDRLREHVYQTLGVNLNINELKVDVVRGVIWKKHDPSPKMISGLITKKRGSYNLFMKNAHWLLYFLLLLFNFLLLAFFLYPSPFLAFINLLRGAKCP